MPSSINNNVWGNQKKTVELEMPSGQMCLVKKPDPQRLATLGIIDKVDTLTKLVDVKHVKRVKGKPSSVPAKVDAATISNNPKAMVDMLELADRVVEQVVLEPPVLRPVVRDSDGTPLLRKNSKNEDVEIPLPWKDRDDDQIYTDLIDFVDRIFIFQHAVGGNPDLATFREQSSIDVLGVADGEGVSV
jgi:hypothetical protein